MENSDWLLRRDVDAIIYKLRDWTWKMLSMKGDSKAEAEKFVEVLTNSANEIKDLIKAHKEGK